MFNRIGQGNFALLAFFQRVKYTFCFDFTHQNECKECPIFLAFSVEYRSRADNLTPVVRDDLHVFFVRISETSARSLVRLPFSVFKEKVTKTKAS